MTIHAISLRNQFKGRIREIIIGDVVSEVDVETLAGIITATLNTRSINEMGFQVGSEVLVLLKETRVGIATV